MANIIHCNECEATTESISKPSQSQWARKDSYGIFTGVYCDKCYNSSKYTYRKDNYFDTAYAGERLDND